MRMFPIGGLVAEPFDGVEIAGAAGAMRDCYPIARASPFSSTPASSTDTFFRALRECDQHSLSLGRAPASWASVATLSVARRSPR